MNCKKTSIHELATNKFEMTLKQTRFSFGTPDVCNNVIVNIAIMLYPTRGESRL